MIDLDDELARVARAPLPDPPPLHALVTRAVQLRRRRRARTWGGAAIVVALVAAVAAVGVWPESRPTAASGRVERESRMVAGRFAPGSTTARGQVSMRITLVDGTTFALRLPAGLGLEHAVVRTEGVLGAFTAGVTRNVPLAVDLEDAAGGPTATWPRWAWTEPDHADRPTVRPYVLLRTTADGFPVLVTLPPLDLYWGSALTTLDVGPGRSLTVGTGEACAVAGAGMDEIRRGVKADVHGRGARWCDSATSTVVDVAGDHAFVQRVVRSLAAER